MSFPGTIAPTLGNIVAVIVIVGFSVVVLGFLITSIVACHKARVRRAARKQVQAAGTLGA